MLELRGDANPTQVDVQEFTFFGASGHVETTIDMPAGAICLVDVGSQMRVLERYLMDRTDDDHRVDFAFYIDDGVDVTATDYTIEDLSL